MPASQDPWRPGSGADGARRVAPWKDRGVLPPESKAAAGHYVPAHLMLSGLASFARQSARLRRSSEQTHIVRLDSQAPEDTREFGGLHFCAGTTVPGAARSR